MGSVIRGVATKNQNRSFDLVVVGAGIIGLTAARAWKRKYPDSSVLVLDKEDSSIRHGSGRNSGVIHSGIYYDPDSLRAKLCVEGAKRMCEYVDEKGLWSDACGKLLLPTNDANFSQIDPLLARALANGVQAESVDAQQILDLEPKANAQFGRGIFIPVTRVTDPKRVIAALAEELKLDGVEIQYGQAVTAFDSDGTLVQTEVGAYSAGRVINAAGLHADEVAKSAGLEFQYEFQPFKGKYWRYDGAPIGLKRLVYAIPNLNLPFLGVHSVHNAAGDLYFGPSSTPVLGRENYQGLDGLHAGEMLELSTSLMKKLLLNTNGLRTLAAREIGLLFKSGLAKEVCALVPSVDPNYLRLSDTKVGIRSQIFDPKAKALVSDFVTLRQGSVLHVLNAISPAFSASFAFADFLIEKIE